MKIIIKESQLKKIYEVEEKKILNENFIGWVLGLGLGWYAIKLIKLFYQKYLSGKISKKQFYSKVKEIKSKDKESKKYSEDSYKDTYNYKSYETQQIGIKTPNIVIGDPHASVIAGKSRKFNLIGRKSGEGSLWKPGADVTWLKNAARKFPTSPNVKNVAICIGTNDGFNINDPIDSLFDELRSTFPNANFYTIEGSWGKGSLSDIEIDRVDRYYNKFKRYSSVIGSVGDISKLKLRPHDPKIKSYDELAKELDRNS